MIQRLGRRVALIVLMALVWGNAHAQDGPSPVASQFQLYNEALQRGDLVAAEAAASAALSASEQRDGDGNHTPVLALNLARVRIALGQWQQASAPARRAYELSRAGAPGSNVDPLMSALMWGRVQLGLEGLAGASFLSDALEAASGRDDLLGDRYDGAEQLGLWAMEVRRYLIARRAWEFAVAAADGAPYDAAFARGRARAYEGIAITLQTITRDVVLPSLVAREARERFSEAHSLLQPLALLDAPDGQLTAAQELYAQVLAWDATIWSKMTSDDASRRGEERLDANPAIIEGATVCAIHRLQRPGLQYPAQQTREEQLGAVVVRLRFGAGGAYVGADIAAAVGDEDFERVVGAAAAQWTFAANPQSSEGCRVPSVFFVPVTFFMRE